MNIVRAGLANVEFAREAITKLHARALPTDAALVKFLANPDCYMFLALDGDRVIGSLTGYALEQYWSFQEFFLYEIDVLEEERNRGVGTKLVEAFALAARDAGAGNAWVLTNRSNTAAMRTYAKCGFVPSDETDEVMMTLSFDPPLE